MHAPRLISRGLQARSKAAPLQALGIVHFLGITPDRDEFLLVPTVYP
jgi:hypothetical protein